MTNFIEFMNNFLQNPNWSGNIFRGNDIALINIEPGMDISGNGFAAVIPMAEEGSDWIGAECVITGWGDTRFGNSFTYNFAMRTVCVIKTLGEHHIL